MEDSQPLGDALSSVYRHALHAACTARIHAAILILDESILHLIGFGVIGLSSKRALMLNSRASENIP